MFKRILPIIIVFLSTVLATSALFHYGLFPSHDGEYHMIRFYEFYRSLQSGQWYPRWAPDLYFGYGIPLFTYVYPLPNYVASFFHVFGASFIDSFKINLILASFVGAISMYFFAKAWWGKMGGIISAIFYTFSPYHFVDIYIRGSVGEVWALALFPLFLFLITKYFSTKKFLFANLSAGTLALIIFSHNILGLLFFPFAISYMLFLILQNPNKRSALLTICYVLLLGLGLSGIFWLPALLETKYVVGLQVFDYTKNFPELFQLLFPSWGSGFFGSGGGSEMSVQIGVANLLAVAGSILLLIKIRKHPSNVLIFFLIWFFIACFFMLKISLSFWQHIPLMQYFQFPWRLLSLVILSTSFLAGSFVNFFKPKFATALFVFFCLITTISYAHPAYYMERNDTYYTTRSNFIDGTNSVGNNFNTKWANGITQRSTQEVQFEENLQKPATIHLAMLYFPNWHVFANGKERHIFPDKDGTIAFDLPQGKYSIGVQFINTQIESIASAFSFLALLILLTCILRRYLLISKIF